MRRADECENMRKDLLNQWKRGGARAIHADAHDVCCTKRVDVLDDEIGDVLGILGLTGRIDGFQKVRADGQCCERVEYGPIGDIRPAIRYDHCAREVGQALHLCGDFVVEVHVEFWKDLVRHVHALRQEGVLAADNNR
eukprot:scaffold135260_cov24-Tisochrysis_lutea.AAC.1